MRHYIFSLLVLASLSGCQPADEVGWYQEEVKICMGSSWVNAIDVSYWQSQIDWTKVHQSGRSLAVARAAYGTTGDTRFAENWAGMKNAGMFRSAYQFFRPSQDPIAQADKLLDMMGPLEDGDLPPVLDVEDDPNGTTPSVDVIRTKVQTWLNHVEQAIGRPPLIYTGYYYWNSLLATDASFARYPLWIASWPAAPVDPTTTTKCPNIPKPWSDLTTRNYLMWQYSSTGHVAGIGTTASPIDVDLDWFNGSLAELTALTTWTVPPEVDGAVPLDASVVANADAAVADVDAARPAEDAAQPVSIEVGKNNNIGACNMGGTSSSFWAGGLLALLALMLRRRLVTK